MSLLVLLQSIWVLVLAPTVWAQQTVSTPADSVPEAKMHYSFARQYHRNKQYDDAILQYRKSLSYDPHNPQAHYHLGNIYYLDKADTTSALAAYRQAVALDSAYVNAYHRLSRIYYARANYDSAIVAFEQLAVLRPDEPDFRRRLVLLHVYRGQHGKAVPHAKKLSELFPDDADLLTELADCYRECDLQKDAYETYERVLSIRPRDAHILRTLIQFEQDAGDETKILEHSKALAGIDSTNYQLLTKIAKLAQKLDQLDDMERALRKMAFLRPDDAFPVGHLAGFYFNAGKFQKAKHWIDRGLKLSPKDGRLLVLDGEYYLTSDPPDSIYALKQFAAALEDPAWRSYAQQMIWTIKPPLTEEEKQKREFFRRGKEQKEGEEAHAE